jgi:SsrA-binding protein
VKCEIAVAKGKQDWDKRETERRREADREARAAVARSRKI